MQKNRLKKIHLRPWLQLCFILLFTGSLFLWSGHSHSKEETHHNENSCSVCFLSHIPYTKAPAQQFVQNSIYWTDTLILHMQGYQGQDFSSPIRVRAPPASA